ncbi:tail fiber domain-containing protein [Blautia fusiformis]|uniref:Tail fiber domain-containing protein n=1 Tax=Blautia fusiformis TaxID=2881264 RepID=A0AAW4WAS8_9FIRM|nr:tail fiber domain-containing protein [Blautia fusiformis]
MINVSNAFREKLEAGEPVRMVVDITFPDGTKKTINKDIMNGDNGFSDCADSSSFPVGVTVCKTLTLSINNDQEQWKNYNFYGAKIHAYLKLQTSYAAPESVSTLLDESYNPILDSTGDPIIATQAATKDIIETIDKGVYTVTTPEQYSDIINVTALDDMYKANKTYTSGLKLPQSLINLVRDACKTVGIGMNLTMDHGDIIIRSVPDSMTFRQLFGYAAMVESANARIDYSGNLQFVKWDFGKMESDNAATVDTDGFVHFGDANPSIDTDGFVSLPGWTINAEGFLALTSGPGSDVQRLMAYANPPALSSDDIVITGIKVMNGQSNDDANTDYSGMYGEEGYVLELENELIDTDQLQTVANIIGEQIVGARFRNLEGDLVYNPLVEFGDMVYTYDRLGNKYLTPLTDVSGNVGGLTTVKTQADDPIRGSSDFYGNSTKAIVAARQMVRKETSAREEAIRRLAETLNSSSGLYMTQEPQQDGSIIYYMHNKPTIAESNIIWKLTAEAFAVSIDGGKTYPYGFAVTGELITRLLYAEGINADYINAGTLVVRDKSGNAIFEADMDTGSVTLDGSCVTIGGKPLDEKIEDVENMAALARNMTMQLDNDYQGIPVDSDGNYTEFPECTTTATVMYGTQDITDNCTYTITTSQNVQGNWNKENKTYTVTGLTADSGWVNIKAAYLNNLVVSKQFSLAKQYAGPQGIPGKDGEDGKTQYTHLAYANSADGKTDFSVSDGNREYIGMYVDFVEADSTDPTKYTWSLIKGADGAQGVPGTPGVNGKTPYFHIAYANSADGRTGFSVDDSVNKLYIGQYTDYTPDDSTDPTKYSWTKIKGEPGTAGRTYFFQSNADVLLMGADKKITPASLIVDSFYRDGNGEIAQSQKGWWKLEKSTDNGATWATLTVSQTAALDRLKINVNGLSLKAHDMLKVSLYFDQSKSKLADYQTYSVAVDVASLTQEQIVDILSDSGKFKGLYYEKDESGNQTLFISFNAMKGGVISLGGTNNGNGQLKIYDADGNQISRLGYTGYVVLNKNTGNPMVSLNTAGLRLYTDYTDSENYNALMLGKYGLYAQKVQNNVPELWMEGDTSKKWEGYIVRYLNNKVRINTNSLFTDGCELGANFSTDGSATVGKGLSVGGNATVNGTLMFYDLENQAKTSGKVKRQPVASVSADDSQVAYLFSGTGSKHGDAATYRRLGIRAKWGGSGFSTDYLYTASQVSDIRLKENIENSETDALETVNQMKVRQFDWKERMGGWHQNIGFVADELEEIDPNLALGGGYDENGEMDIKQINSPYLLNYAIKAIQELSAKVDEQEKHIKELERRLQ